MRLAALVLAAAPLLALAAPSGPPAPGGGDEAAARAERARHARLERMLGLADALDLDEAGAARLRQTLARNDDQRAPLQRQAADALRVLRTAASGDPQAQGQVDGAVQRLDDARDRLRQLDQQLFAELTNGASPDRKARVALFLARVASRPGSFLLPPRDPSRPTARVGPGAGPGPGPSPGSPVGVPPGYVPRPPTQAQPVPGAQPPPPAARPLPPPQQQAPPPPADQGGAPEPEDWFSDV